MLKLNLIHSFAVVIVELIFDEQHVAFLNACVVKSGRLCGVLCDVVVCRAGVTGDCVA